MMKKYCLIFLMAAAGLTACSHPDDAPADIPQATERGQSDAQALLNLSADDVRGLHSALLSVKAREWEMRRGGNEPYADAYISAFKEYVTSRNKALADEIF